MNFSKHAFLPVMLALLLAGCSSNADKERQIEAIAKHRASTLSNNLPIEHGPLTIMQAKAKGNVVELMMIYNGDNSIPVQQLLSNSISYYCSNSEVTANLSHGIVYDIKMRSPRGQLLVEKVISQNDCNNDLEPEMTKK